jgi:TolA-binding protein
VEGIPAVETITAARSSSKPRNSLPLARSTLSNLSVTDSDRVRKLERAIVFLQEKHQDLLVGLHEEVKSLKDKNRELLYNLTMKQEGWIDARPSSSSGLSDPRPGSASRSTISQIKQFENQLSEANAQISELSSRNQYLTNLIYDMKRNISKEDVQHHHKVPPGTAPATIGKREPLQDSLSYLNLNSSLNSSIGTTLRSFNLGSSHTGHIPQDDPDSLVRALRIENEHYRREVSEFV